MPGSSLAGAGQVEDELPSRPTLPCNQSVTLNESFDMDAQCPGNCPYHAMDVRHGMPSCTASCVVASQCALYNPDAPVPDQEFGTCRGALVDGLSLSCWPFPIHFKSHIASIIVYSVRT